MNVQVGATALHWACQLGHAQTAEFLISAGADIEGKNMVMFFSSYDFILLTLLLVWQNAPS